MSRKQVRPSNRAARYRGECHFPRVVPETGLLRMLGWLVRPARPTADAAAAARETEKRGAVASK